MLKAGVIAKLMLEDGERTGGDGAGRVQRFVDTMVGHQRKRMGFLDERVEDLEVRQGVESEGGTAEVRVTLGTAHAGIMLKR